MKRIVLCFDGTWNHPDDKAVSDEERVESNVVRFRQSISKTGSDGIQQETWYNAGVGTAWWNQLSGGVFGAGIDLHIIEGYQQLARMYDDGDEVYIVGFSRGAYTARSLVGMIRNCGLVSRSMAKVKSGIAYGIYRTRGDGPDSTVAQAFRSTFSREISIHFVGVWDTVGALGIPLDFADRLNVHFYQFHDTQLSGIVRNAYQAIAVEEHRKQYDIALWDPQEKPNQTIEQRWFVGAHADVGGGYPDRRLSDISLRWMQERALALGLTLSLVAPGDDNYRAIPTDSFATFLGGRFAKFEAPHFRRVLGSKFGNEVIDSSVDRRRRDPALDYRPVNVGLPELTE
jgi:uncharacterized protein (DUF2235 family)